LKWRAIAKRGAENPTYLQSRHQDAIDVHPFLHLGKIFALQFRNKWYRSFSARRNSCTHGGGSPPQAGNVP
jgi:hypothetical protein